MRKMWRVGSNEFKRNVFTKGFIFALLSVPLFISLIFGMGFIFELMEDNNEPLGYVDHSNVLAEPIPAPADDPVEMISFDSEAAARQALEGGQIQAYYVISPDYLESREVDLVYLDRPGENAEHQFYDFLQINLLSDFPSKVANRAAAGTDMTLRTPDGSRTIPDGGPQFKAVLPIFIGMAFVGMTLFSSGYLMEAMAQERGNRVIEVLTTSVSTTQLVTGKILGIVAINLLQMSVWVIFGLLVVFLGRDVLNMAWFQNPEVDWGSVLTMIAIALPSYIMASALMFAVGSNIADSQEGQWVGMVFYLLFLSPAILIVPLVENHTIQTLLTILPFTSLLSFGVRNMFSVVPAWQFLLSIAVQALCAVGAIWIAARAFRLGMLRYGQRVRISEVLGRGKRKKVMEEAR
jgi:ABC-2 type transport system permease protein